MKHTSNRRAIKITDTNWYDSLETRQMGRIN